MEFIDGILDPIEHSKLIEQQRNLQFPNKGESIKIVGLEDTKEFFRREKENDKKRREKEKIIRQNKICYICESSDTHIRTNGKDVWVGKRDDNGELIGLLCINCYRQIRRETVNTCYKCSAEQSIVNLNIYRDDVGYWDGESYVCRNGCAKTRTGNLDPSIAYSTGYITEKLIGKFLGIETCSDRTGKINRQKGYDLWHEDWERIQSKGATLGINNGIPGWQYGIYKNIVCDFFFCIGYDKERRHVESMHIIPNNEDICKLSGLFISELGYSRFDIFEEEVKPWDDLFHTMRLDNCPAFSHRNI